MQIGQLSLDVDEQKSPRIATPETVGEQTQKRRQPHAQRGNLLQCHPDDPP
jgi:hypothetical protein